MTVSAQTRSIKHIVILAGQHSWRDHQVRFKAQFDSLSKLPLCGGCKIENVLTDRDIDIIRAALALPHNRDTVSMILAEEENEVVEEVVIIGGVAMALTAIAEGGEG